MSTLRTQQPLRPKFYSPRILTLSLIAVFFLLSTGNLVAQSMGELLDDLNEIGEIKDFVKDPDGFAKGKLKGAAKKWIKDAAFGPQMSTEMTEVFRRVASKHYNSNVGGRCPRAAHGNAGSVLFDLKSNGAFMWLPRALTSSVETIITQDWVGWIKDKAKSEIENKLKEYFDGIPPESYSTNSTKGECTFGVLATID